MTALAKGAQRPQVSDPALDSGPQKGNTVVFQGGLVMVDASGYLHPAGAGSAGAYCCGVAQPRDQDLDRYDATGLADGAQSVTYEEGAFGLQNDDANPIVATTQPGTILFAVDDQTVSLSSSGGTRPVAGRLRELDTSVIGGPVVVEISKTIGKAAAELLAIDTGAGFLAGAAFRAVKNVAGHNGAGACVATGAKVGDIVLGISFAKVPTAAAATQAGLTAFESTISVAGEIQQTGAANLSAEDFDVLLLAQS